MRRALLPIALLTSGFAQQPDPLLWGSLVPGPYPIGYRSYFASDSSRMYGQARGPRPILVSLWYPAAPTRAEVLRYRAYLSLPPLERYPRFVPQLEAFLLDAVGDDLFHKKRNALAPHEHEFLNALLSKPTLAHRNANAATGLFPVLLYHSGAAGSYEDNSVLCEYLASHGYIVATSAFPSPDGKHVGNNYGGPETSWGDLAFLLAEARALGSADLVNTGALGHSAGAQYLLEWLAQRPPPLRAMVSLDTTLEYTPENFKGHRSLRRRLARLTPVNVPVLVAASADRSPRFATWNRYLPRRADASIRHFTHGDYLLHGSLARAFSGEQATAVRDNYDQLARTIRAFFDAHLRHSPTAWERVLDRNNDAFRVVQRESPPRGSQR